MGEGDFTTVDTHIATATWDPPAADRYQARISVSQAGGHNDADETLTLRTNNNDAFYEVPNAPAGATDDVDHPYDGYGGPQPYRELLKVVGY